MDESGYDAEEERACVKFRYLNKRWSQTPLFTYAPIQLPHNPGERVQQIEVSPFATLPKPLFTGRPELMALLIRS
jgi:hypothetical protein